MSVNKNKNVVYLGSSGFPYGLAEIQKIVLISKSLVLAGNNVNVICKSGVHNKMNHPELQTTGEFEDINYVYTSGDPFNQSNVLKRRLLKAKGIVNEFLLLKKLSQNNKIDFAILSTENFYLVTYYCFLSKLLNFKTVLNYVEYNSGIKKEPFRILKKINDLLFDKYSVKMVDSILPISEFLINRIESVVSGAKYLKVSGLTDFDKYNNILISLEEKKYFLFCGSAYYKEIILFIIDCFSKLNNKLTSLYLVINGSEQNILEVKKYINESVKKRKIKMFSNLSDKELFTYYKNATALLIPLRPTFQDIARFPHKIGEYLGSGNPVISTNYGEVKYYFKDMEDMLLAESYNIDLFAEKMKFVIDNPLAAREIGVKGREKAMQLFDYRFAAKEIDLFLNSQLESTSRTKDKISKILDPKADN
ncbi:MAG TPA: glycosyltransferase [Hanamia sp.]